MWVTIIIIEQISVKKPKNLLKHIPWNYLNLRTETIHENNIAISMNSSDNSYKMQSEEFYGPKLGLGIHFLTWNLWYLHIPQTVVRSMEMALGKKIEKKKEKKCLLFLNGFYSKFKMYLHFSVAGACGLTHKAARE